MVSSFLAGLLCMGAHKKAYSFSWASRGLPKVRSEGMDEIWKNIRVIDLNYPSYLTRHELQTKRAELLVSPDEHALILLPQLQELVKALPPHDGDPRHQRIIFWFPQG